MLYICIPLQISYSIQIYVFWLIIKSSASSISACAEVCGFSANCNIFKDPYTADTNSVILKRERLLTCLQVQKREAYSAILFSHFAGSFAGCWHFLLSLYLFFSYMRKAVPAAPRERKWVYIWGAFRWKEIYFLY